MRILSNDIKFIEVYEEREKDEKDQLTAISYANELGVIKGRKVGVIEGIAQGIAQGVMEERAL